MKHAKSTATQPCNRLRRTAPPAALALYLASPAYASKEGGYGVAEAIFLAFGTLAAAICFGFMAGVVMAHRKKRPYFKSALQGIAVAVAGLCTLAGSVALAMSVWSAWLVQEYSGYAPYGDKAKELIQSARPGELRQAISSALQGVPPSVYEHTSLSVLETLREHLSWHPLGWTQQDTAAVAQFGGSFAVAHTRAEASGTAAGIDWINGRESSRMLCDGPMLYFCLRMAAFTVSEACSRNENKVPLPACSKENLQRAADYFHYAHLPGP